jgi:hypothetical protein
MVSEVRVELRCVVPSSKLVPSHESYDVCTDDDVCFMIQPPGEKTATPVTETTELLTTKETPDSMYNSSWITIFRSQTCTPGLFINRSIIAVLALDADFIKEKIIQIDLPDLR